MLTLHVLYSELSVACVLAVTFEVYTLSNSDNVYDECCVLACVSDTHLRRLFVVISVMNSQDVSFRTPPPNSLYTYHNLCLNVLSTLSVACVLAVNFEVYTLSNSDNVCDECCVRTTRISNDDSS